MSDDSCQSRIVKAEHRYNVERAARILLDQRYQELHSNCQKLEANYHIEHRHRVHAEQGRQIAEWYGNQLLASLKTLATALHMHITGSSGLSEKDQKQQSRLDYAGLFLEREGLRREREKLLQERAGYEKAINELQHRSSHAA